MADDPLNQRQGSFQGHDHHTDVHSHTLITTDDNLEKIAEKAIEEDNIARKLGVETRVDYYLDQDMRSHVRHLLDEQFRDPANMKLQISWRNIVKMIIRKISLVYKDAPVRTIFNEKTEDVDVPDPEGEEGETIKQEKTIEIPSPEDQKLWDDIAKFNKLDILLKTVNRMTNLTRRVVIKVGFDKKKEMVKLSMILPSTLDIVVDESDTLKPLAMFWNVNSLQLFRGGDPRISNIVTHMKGEDILYEYWSSDDEELKEELRSKNFIFNQKGEIQDNEDSEENESNNNPIKDMDGNVIIPVVEYAPEVPIRDWFVGGLGDLINAQETINVALTYLNYLIKMQSFSQPVARGVEANETEDPLGNKKETPAIMTDPSMVILLKTTESDQSPSMFEFRTPNASMIEVKDIIREKLVDIAADYAISVSNFVEQATPSSGIAIKLQNQDLLEFRSDEIDLYRCYEEDLFQTIKAVQNTFPGKSFTKESQMRVNFAEIKFPESRKEQLEALDMGIAIGVDSAADFLMEQDPDLTEEQAIKKLMENIKIRNRIANKVPAATGPGGQEIIPPLALNLNPNSETVDAGLTEEVPEEEFAGAVEEEV